MLDFYAHASESQESHVILQILFPFSHIEFKYAINFFFVAKCLMSFSGHESKVNLEGGFRELRVLPTLSQRL
jgi:hypothetical protein